MYLDRQTLLIPFRGSAREISISVTLHNTALHVFTKTVPATVLNYLQSKSTKYKVQKYGILMERHQWANI